MQKIKRPIDIYNEEIVPKIKSIDYLIKTKNCLSIEECLEIMDISEDELLKILKRLDIEHINSSTILPVMIEGKSSICKMMKREIDRGSPNFYTPEDLSYIYNIDYDKTKKAYSFLELRLVSSKQIPAILMQI